jgi:hypothetical protein
MYILYLNKRESIDMGLIEVDTWDPHVWWRRDAYHPERATFLKKKDLQVNLQYQHYCNDRKKIVT